MWQQWSSTEEQIVEVPAVEGSSVPQPSASTGLDGDTPDVTRRVAAKAASFESKLARAVRLKLERVRFEKKIDVVSCEREQDRPQQKAKHGAMCVESDWPGSQTFHSSEQRCRGYFWFQPKVSTRLRIVTENWKEMKQQDGNE